MRWKLAFILAAMVGASCASTAERASEAAQPLVTMDEALWATFYDVPSRRFRDIRSAFVQRRFQAAANNLITSANYIQVEADRASPALAQRLSDVSAKMKWTAGHVEDTAVTLAELDSLFARSHWLLAQHYLEMARRSRDNQHYRNEGLYLWATTHHMERAVLWSNARIDRRLHNALESLRDLSARLQEPDSAAAAARERPLVRADKVLRDIGKHIDRPVVLTSP